MRTVAALLPLSLALALVGCSSEEPKRAQLVPTDKAGELLIDRNWIDVLPKTKQDRLHVYRFVPSMGGGVYHDRTVFKGEFELFVYRVNGEKIDFVFPEDGTRVSSGYRIEKIDDNDFDLRLTIDKTPRGPAVYYNLRNDKAGVDLDARLQSLIPNR